MRTLLKRMAGFLVLTTSLLSITATPVAQNANGTGSKTPDEPVYITLNVRSATGEPVRLSGPEGGPLAYRFGEETFGLTPILRDRGKGVVEVRVFQLTEHHGQVFKDLASVLANGNSTSLVFGDLPFRIELDSIANRVVEKDKAKHGSLPLCGVSHCLEGELCLFCDDGDECSYWCGEMCRIPPNR